MITGHWRAATSPVEGDRVTGYRALSHAIELAAVWITSAQMGGGRCHLPSDYFDRPWEVDLYLPAWGTPR